MTEPIREPDVLLQTLPNGVRVLAIPLPHLDSVSLSVFVRTGSRHESARLNGISHFVEHMAFKGTHARDAHRINLDAERLGADVNAHTDKDHTAYHIRGMARHAGAFIGMLADIVQNSTFPEAELERERQVILQEFIEDEEDPLSTAFKLFDKTSYGTHPLAQAVIGTRRNIERLTRDEMLAYVARQYSGPNVIVGVAGRIDPDQIARDVGAAFGGLPSGAPNDVVAPAYVGGARWRRLSGSSQSHVVLGFPIESLAGDYPAGIVAAALFGEGMSSPLMHELRERRGLVYYAACSADVTDLTGQFVVEASTTPEHLDEFFTEVARLLTAHAEHGDAIGLERARNQIAVRRLRSEEQPFRRIEESALDLFMFGRVRSRAELDEGIAGVGAADVRGVFERMLASRASLAIAGKVPKGMTERIPALFAPSGA